VRRGGGDGGAASTRRAAAAPPPRLCSFNGLTSTSYVRILMLFNIFLHPSRSPASSCHSGTSSPLSHGFTRRASEEAHAGAAARGGGAETEAERAREAGG
jgi:hypothetical protein